MRTTLWKIEPLPLPKSLLRDCEIFPLGDAGTVTSALLEIPRMRIFFSEKTIEGYITLLWEVDQGLVLNLKDEPEFGKGGVFSIIIQDRSRVENKDFFRFYVQAFERLGICLLENERLIPVRAFKKQMLSL